MAMISILFFPLSCTFLSSGAKSEPIQNLPEGVDEYFIGQGDVLEIITWKEPELSREVKVRQDGKITFPLLDDIQAEGRRPVDVKNEIQERLAEFVKIPSITVTVKETGSQKIYILGEVQKKGEYLLTKEITMLQAVAMAGGFTEWASKKEILLIRRKEGENKIIRLNYQEIIEGENPGQNVPLKANDTIIVP